MDDQQQSDPHLGPKGGHLLTLEENRKGGIKGGARRRQLPYAARRKYAQIAAHRRWYNRRTLQERITRYSGDALEVLRQAKEDGDGKLVLSAIGKMIELERLKLLLERESGKPNGPAIEVMEVEDQRRLEDARAKRKAALEAETVEVEESK